MKKVLLATTMLAGTAGFASAEVSVTGWAEIGIWSYSHDATGVWSGDALAGPTTDSSVAFWQDVEVTFTMTGTTDGGLEFGAKIDLDESNVGLNDHSGTEVWVSGAFGKIAMGDTDGALDWALVDMDGGMTSMADDHSTHLAWFGGSDADGLGDGQVVRYENTFGDIAFAISAEQADDGTGLSGNDDIFGVGVKYTANLGGTDVALGLAYQDAGNQGSALGVSAGATLAGGFGGKIGYIRGDDVGGPGVDGSHIGAELSYVSGPIGVAVNYGKVELDGVPDVDSWGAVANYDLGGGAKVMFGYGSDVGSEGSDQWSLGLGLAF